MKWHTYGILGSECLGILGSECLGISVSPAKEERGREKRERDKRESYTGVVYIA